MKEVVVIGAGVIGLCSAVYSAQRGWKVTVIDRNSEDHQGCSYGNAGMIVPSHFIPLAAPGAVSLGLRWMTNPESPFWIKPRLDAALLDWGIKFWRASNARHVKRAAPLLRDLHLASRNCFERLATESGNAFGLVQKGLLALCKTEHALEEEARVAEQARGLGVPAEVLDPRQTAALDPNVTMDVAGAVYFPRDCHLIPKQFMESLESLARQSNVKFLFKCEAEGFVVEGNHLSAVKTNEGELPASAFVLAGGSWSSGLASTLGLKLPMQPGKGYSLTLENPPQLPSICSILTEARVAVTPMGKALRAGGTMEMAGLNEEINPRRVQGIIKALPRYFPRFSERDFENVKPWQGLRPVSPDGLPFLGKTRRFANLLIATGHAMMGLSLGPISGKIISELLCGSPPSIDVGLLDPDRYN